MIPINLNWAITLNSLCCRKPFRNIWIFHAFSTLKSFNLQTEFSRTKSPNLSISIVHCIVVIQNWPEYQIHYWTSPLQSWLVAWLVVVVMMPLTNRRLPPQPRQIPSGCCGHWSLVMVPGINQLRIRCGCWCLLVRPPSQTCNYFQIWTNCIILIN